MSRDLLERARMYTKGLPRQVPIVGLVAEIADELERLREDVKRLEFVIEAERDHSADIIAELTEERDRARFNLRMAIETDESRVVDELEAVVRWMRSPVDVRCRACMDDALDDAVYGIESGAYRQGPSTPIDAAGERRKGEVERAVREERAAVAKYLQERAAFFRQRAEEPGHHIDTITRDDARARVLEDAAQVVAAGARHDEREGGR